MPHVVFVVLAGLLSLSSVSRSAAADGSRRAEAPPTANHAERAGYGINFVTDAAERVPLERFAAAVTPMPARVVVLIHGLDDPGWLWRDMIPALRDTGRVVARMEYPNDGPIARSADLLAMNLRELRAAGVEHVEVVAHSMGGLVTRDVLTRPAYYDGDAAATGARGEIFPSVDRFVMCGTPNHGSQLARLRAVTEVQEQLMRAFAPAGGAGGLFGGLGDGDGEAGPDLLPGSDFLTSLNGRPLPAGVGITIIAGRLSPVAAEDVDRLAERVRRMARSHGAPAWLQGWVDAANDHVGNALDEAADGVGDGCVTIESARLEGVADVVVVEANHISMIVNLLPSAKTVPPAIPIVLDRLTPAVSADAD